jgi:hypothetical protein
LTAALWQWAHNGHGPGVVHGTVMAVDRVRDTRDLLYFNGTVTTASTCKG